MEEKEQKPAVDPMFGKPWKTVNSFSTYESADQKRAELAVNDGINVKIKRSAEGQFHVKIRPVKAAEKPGDKKKGSKGKAKRQRQRKGSNLRKK